MKTAAFKSFHILEERSNFSLLKEILSPELTPEWKKFHYLLGQVADQYGLLILQMMKDDYEAKRARRLAYEPELRHPNETLARFIDSNTDGYVNDCIQDLRHDLMQQTTHSIIANKSKFITKFITEPGEHQ